jgi:hypothetical protein
LKGVEWGINYPTFMKGLILIVPAVSSLKSAGFFALARKPAIKMSSSIHALTRPPFCPAGRPRY